MADPSSGLIDPAPLRRSIWGSLVLLLLSTWVTILAMALIFFVTSSVLAVPFFFFFLILLPTLIAKTGILTMTGLIVVPLCATLAGLLGVHYASYEARIAFRIAEPDPNDPLGSRVLDLSSRLGLKTPPAASWHEEMFNAYAAGAGAEASIVVIGRRLAEVLEPIELDAIIAHELGHVVTGDCNRLRFGHAYQQWLTWFFLWHGLQKAVRWILTPGSEMLLLAQSRNREYWADAIGAALSSKDAMISALEKIHRQPPPSTGLERRQAAFMFRGFSDGLWRTHPTLEQRVSALRGETYLSRLRYRRRIEAADEAPRLDGPGKFSEGL